MDNWNKEKLFEEILRIRIFSTFYIFSQIHEKKPTLYAIKNGKCSRFKQGLRTLKYLDFFYQRAIYSNLALQIFFFASINFFKQYLS